MYLNFESPKCNNSSMIMEWAYLLNGIERFVIYGMSLTKIGQNIDVNSQFYYGISILTLIV
jgi:hypothetical protein